MNNDLKGKFIDMTDTSIFVRNGLHSPIVTEESIHDDEDKRDEEMSSAWRILKIILFVIFLIVFVHQTVTLFKLYYSYPTTTTTYVTQPSHFKVPAVTFCSDNPTKRSDFCGKSDSLCGMVTNISCPNVGSKVANFGYCTETKGNALDDFRKELCSRENFKKENEANCKKEMKSLVWTIKKNETELTPTYVEDPDPQWRTLLTCLSTNLQLTDQLAAESWPIESETQGKVFDSYNITVDKGESFYPWKEPQVFLSIHSPFVPVNPLLEGVPLKIGYSYIIHVRLEEEHLLPDPYETNCTNYDALWRKNNMTGHRSQEMCRDECLWFTTPNSLSKMVLPDYKLDAFKAKYVNLTSEQCMENCSADCTKLKYSYTVFERISGANIDGHLPSEKGEISVQILMATPEVRVTTHIPLYDFGYLISHMGGLLAFWIGISIWALIGLIEKAIRKIMEWVK